MTQGRARSPRRDSSERLRKTLGGVGVDEGCWAGWASCWRSVWRWRPVSGASTRRASSRPRPANGWTYGRTYDEQRFSPLKQIDAATIGKLGVAWWAEFDTDRGQEATPLVADGMLYTTTAWSKVFAFDARTGKPLWTFDPKVPGEKGFNACCDVVNRGVAIWQGMVYVGTIDGRLIALDRKTGQPEWTVQTTNPDRPYTITGAPRAIKGKILIGNGGAEYGVRGYVSAFDAKTGALDWRFYMTPNPRGLPDDAASDGIMKAKAAATWSDGYWRQTGGGGTPWDAITYDPSSTWCSWAPATAIPGTTSSARGARATTSSCRPSWRYGPTPASTSGTTRPRPARAGTTRPCSTSCWPT